MPTPYALVPAILISGLIFTATPATAQATATAADTATAAADLPEIEKLLERAVEAAGGRKAIDAIKTTHVINTMEAGGQLVETESFWSRDGGRMLKMTSDLGEMTMATNGKVRWMAGPMGVMPVGDAQAEQLGQAGMHMMMVDPKLLAEEDDGEFAVVAKEEFNNAECYKCSYTEPNSEDERFLFFDVKTGLPAGFSETTSSPGGTDVTIVTLEDWKEIADVKFFHTVRFSSPTNPQQTGEIKVARLVVNTLEPDFFTPPAEAEAFAAEQAETEAAGGIKLEDLTAEQQTEASGMLSSMKQAPGVATLKQAMSGIEQGLPFFPEDQKALMQYVVQELKKEIAARGG